MISVIIPTYNNAEFLNRCIGSVPSSPSVQIIVVDDGSTDDTQAVLAGIKEAYPGMVVTRKERGGVSSARNLGLKNASGDFVVFLDADDSLTRGALERVLEMPDDLDADIVVMRSFGSVEKYPWKGIFSENTGYQAQQLMKPGYIRGSVCGCLFRKSFIERNDVNFCERLTIAEDTLFFASLLSLGATVKFADIKFYEVTERRDSASRKYDDGFIKRYGKTLLALREGIGDRCVADNTIMSVLLGIVNVAVKMGYTAGELSHLIDLDPVLPLSSEVFGHNRFLARTLNCSFPAFFAIKKWKDILTSR